MEEDRLEAVLDSWKETVPTARSLEAAVTPALAHTELISNSPCLCVDWMTVQPLASKFKVLN